MRRNNHEHWFSKCAKLGWERREDFQVVSPTGVIVTWDDETGTFRCGEMADIDFKQLAHDVIAKLNAELHGRRSGLLAVKRTIREMRDVIGEKDPFDPSVVNKWEDDGDGGATQYYNWGPIEVSAEVVRAKDGFSWHTVMSNGQMKNSEQGAAASLEEGKLRVFEAVSTWCDELADTGRYAMKLMKRLNELTE